MFCFPVWFWGFVEEYNLGHGNVLKQQTLYVHDALKGLGEDVIEAKRRSLPSTCLCLLELGRTLEILHLCVASHFTFNQRPRNVK